MSKRHDQDQDQEQGGTCTTIGCPRDAEKDGYCLGCWTAIFGVL